MKKIGLLVLGIMVIGLPVWGFGGPTPAKPTPAATGTNVLAGKIFLIDDFESGNLKAPREWWTFDIKKAEIASNKDLTQGDPAVVAMVGNYSLHFEGPCKNWYAGGAGTYLAKPNQDLSKYNNFQVDVYGNGPGSGTLKIALYDDDNGNWQVEQDPKQNYKTLYDDEWAYNVTVDWVGWKQVTIPISDFVVDNPGAGDGIWNPEQVKGSGGLLQVQFTCLGSSSSGNVNYNVDNPALTIGEQPQQ